MSVTCSTYINAPISKLAELFNDPGHFKDWQDGFVSYEPVVGAPRQVGAKTKITYVNGKHKIELVETIQVMNLPAEMAALHENKHVDNTLISSFTQLPGQKTKYISAIGYIKFKGFMQKLMALLMPGMMKKQT